MQFPIEGPFTHFTILFHALGKFLKVTSLSAQVYTLYCITSVVGVPACIPFLSSFMTG